MGEEAQPLYPPDAVILAPLAGYTDIPFRRSARRHGAQFYFTEMVDAESVLYAFDRNIYALIPDEDESELGLQLVNAKPRIFPDVIARIKDFPFARIDFNLGCPAPKVAAKGEGARLAEEDPDLAVMCLESLVRACKDRFPVTAKFRILSETEPQLTVDFAKRLCEAGAQALTLHGRVRSRFYSGPVFTSIIAAVQAAVSVPVIANGGVMGLTSYNTLRAESGCSRVMVARGAIGNPWLFRELAEQEAYVPPTPDELADEIECYAQDMIAFYKNEEQALKVARKTLLEFLRGRGYGGELRNSVSFLCNTDELRRLLRAVRAGPNEGYWQWLNCTPNAERRLRPASGKGV